MSTVLFAADGPVQVIALVVVVIVGFTLTFAARVLTRKATRDDRSDTRPSQPDDLEPGQD